MLCNVCKKNEAKVHLTQMVEGKIQKVDLCETCAKEKGVDDPTGFSLADLLLGLGASQEIDPSSSGDLSCPFCGLNQATFKKTGRLGCPKCYETFSGGLETMLKSMHKGVRHTGKIPEIHRSSRELVQRSERLQNQLDEAVAKERFEDAAVIRDELKVLRKQLEELKSAAS